MFVNYRGSILGIIGWQWRYMLFFTVAAGAIVAAHMLGPPALQRGLKMPALPLGVVGGAIGIFVSFRTNSAYGRWWEGRKLWGRVVNASRHWGSQTLAYLPADGASPSTTQKRLILRHAGYVHALRCLLRKQPLENDEDVRRHFAPGELSRLSASVNATQIILHLQLVDLQRLIREKALDLLHLQLMDATLRELLDVQGGCERIKNTPFPRGYGYVAERLIVAFGVLLPLAIVSEMGWLAIPMSVLVCSAFLLIGEVGRVLEDPFTLFWPALPLSALSKTIELNLRDLLGERDLPLLPVPNEKGILM